MSLLLPPPPPPLPWGGGEGDSHIKVTGMLVVSLWGANFVSCRVFETESHYICPFWYPLVLCIKKFRKKFPDTDHTEISLRGQFKLEPNLHWSPLGVQLEFLD